MAAELKDFRGKITVEAHCVLEAENRISGRDKSEIVRDILHDWALQRLNTAKVTDSLLKSEGMPGIAGESEGIAGNRGEDRGK
jgi:hypothetical protein